jgi:hypothetical protein
VSALDALRSPQRMPRPASLAGAPPPAQRTGAGGSKEDAMAIERDDEQAKAVSRRGFLSGLGAGAAGAAGAVVLPTDAAAQSRPTTRPDRFSRLFPGLRSFAEETPEVTRALIELGKRGGIMDANDNLAAGPTALIADATLSLNNPDNAAPHTAGTTFLGQFLDHDMTFDTTSRLGIATRPERSPNLRTPMFDLDTVYGGGPAATPQLYNRDKTTFRVEDGGLFEDLPRDRRNTAIIGDPRNDENMMISGLQVAFLLFHNRVVEMLRDDDRRRSSRDGDSTFEEARRIVTWHYHWIILHEFLPAILGQNIVDDIRSRGRRIFTPRAGEQSIPVEFQLMYRFGHSLIRPSYRANLNGDPTTTPSGGPFFAFIFDPAGEGQGDPIDLRGGARAQRRFIGWQTFFDFGTIERPRPVGGQVGALAQDVRRNKIIDTTISTPLFLLPLGTIAGGVEGTPISLPTRNLLRHLTWSVPSGQDVARFLRIPALSSNDLSDLRQFRVGLERSTPLWFYILREAHLMTRGARLAGIGARIIGEVFIGLLELDRNSYLSVNPRWRPTLPSRRRGNFDMVDLLTFAKVDPVNRRQ